MQTGITSSLTCQRGNYTVVITPPRGLTISTGNNTIPVTLSPGQRVDNIDFGLAPRLPRLRLVKRITGVVRDGVRTNFTNFVDDPNDQNDNAPGWSRLQPTGLIEIPASAPLRSGDVVEYTIYFLSDGNVPVPNVNFCDAIPAQTTFIRDSFGSQSGIQFNRAGTNSSLTNEQDSDAGRFFSPLAPLPTGNPCPEQNNPNGSITVNVTEISNTAGSNFGFIRFQVTID
jgi:uncharacterized repeat protein (TIGR01451 family)